nr:hypothetical protein [Tanacetum cinerariifolium]
SNSPQLDNDDLKQIDADDFKEMDLKWQMAMLTMRAKRFLQRTGKNLGANETTFIGFDMSKVECYNCHRRGHFAKKCRLPRDTRNKDTQRRNVLMETSTSNALVSQCVGVGLESVKARLVVYQHNQNVFEEDIKLLKLDVMLRDNALVKLRKKFEKAKKERDELKLTLENFQTSDSDVSMPTSPVHDRYKSGEGYHAVLPPYTGTFMPPKPDLVFYDASTVSETVSTVFNVERSTTKPTKDMSQSNRPSAPIIKDWVSESKDESKDLSQSWLGSPKDIKPLFDVQGNPQQSLKDKAVIDSGCSRHMTGNISYLSDFEKINGGYVAFGGNIKRCVSQMCDKKNIVLFTDTECVVLSSDFKLPDENHLLLRVPRENNIYNVDLKNIVPSKDLTCLFAKATLDEVLVTKPHNMTPYELLLGRTPSIEFMRPFRCPVTIINTLDPLRKFDRKADEGFLVGYSVRNGPTRLFDIDTLTQSMNYQPVVAGNQPNHNTCMQENLDAGKVVKEAKSAQQYVLLPLWSTSSKDSQNTDVDAAFDDQENESEVHVSPSSSDKPKKHAEKDKNEAKGKSPVDLSTGVRDLRNEFEIFYVNSTNGVNAASTPVTAVGLNSTNSTNSFNDVGPSDTAVNMPALEDIIYSDDEEDVGAEADFSNLETSITTRSMERMVKEQGRMNQINDEDFHTCMFACFLSQEKPKRVLQALKDLSWIKVMQEELLKFKMQKVWVLVDLLKGKRAIGSKWVFRNKKDKRGIVIRNKARLVEQGHTQEEGIDYEEVFAPVQKDNGIFISQDKYVADILRKFGLTYGKSTSTPIDTEKPLLKDPNGEDVDVHIYRLMIGSLMYLTSSRPDIMFAVCTCACFQVTPKVSHLHAVKRIFRYLKGKPHLGLWYPKDSAFNLVAYSDSDYAGASLDRKSTTGGFDQIVDFLTAHTIHYALMVNPTIYVSCIKQFWDSVLIKKSNDVMRLQAIIDRKKVIITEDTIRQAL